MDAFQNFNFADLISLDEFSDLFYFPNYFYVFLTILFLWLAKLVFQKLKSIPIEEELVKNDNKAVAFAFTGFLLGFSIILEGVLESDTGSLILNLIDFVIWGILGIVLISLSDLWNDKVILYKVNNLDEMYKEKNLAVGITNAFCYISSGIIIRSAILGPSKGIFIDIALTLLYFLIGQILFSLFSFLYQKLVTYDFQDEIKEKNIAAGTSLGLNLVALSILIGAGINYSFSILYLFSWSIIGGSIIILMRIILDKLIIPSENLDKEIHIDRNWGVALMEGCFSFAGVITLTQIVQ